MPKRDLHGNTLPLNTDLQQQQPLQQQQRHGKGGGSRKENAASILYPTLQDDRSESRKGRGQACVRAGPLAQQLLKSRQKGPMPLQYAQPANSAGSRSSAGAQPANPLHRERRGDHLRETRGCACGGNFDGPQVACTDVQGGRDQQGGAAEQGTPALAKRSHALPPTAMGRVSAPVSCILGPPQTHSRCGRNGDAQARWLSAVQATAAAQEGHLSRRAQWSKNTGL